MKNVLTLDEINSIANEYIRLKNKSNKSKSKKVKQKFANYQNYCVKKLEHLVIMKLNKYKKFPNYLDLKQDGLEALILSLKTFDYSKGNFAAWAHRYIGTRISRAANTHSTIRCPIKKIKNFKPIKVSKFPTLIDETKTPQECLEDSEIKEIVSNAINLLPTNQKSVIILKKNSLSINKISQELKISRSSCVKLLNEAEESLRCNLKELIEREEIIEA